MVWILFEGFQSRGSAIRMLYPTLASSPQLRYDGKCEVRIGNPYGCLFPQHTGYMLHCDGQLSFSAYRAKSYDEPWVDNALLWINFPDPEHAIQWRHNVIQPRSRECLQEILSHHVLEMFTIQRNGRVEEVGWPVDSIW